MVFYVAHVYPHLYFVLPANILLGICLGLLSGGHISFLLTLSHRITGLFHDEDEESRQVSPTTITNHFCNFPPLQARRTCVVRRVARAFQGAQDFGLILGSILSAILITYTVNLKHDSMFMVQEENRTIYDQFRNCNATYNLPHCNMTQEIIISIPEYYDIFLNKIFDQTSDGRLCGSQACPFIFQDHQNNTAEYVTDNFRVLSVKSAEILVGVYAGCLLAALLLGNATSGENRACKQNGFCCCSFAGPGQDQDADVPGPDGTGRDPGRLQVGEGGVRRQEPANGRPLGRVHRHRASLDVRRLQQSKSGA